MRNACSITLVVALRPAKRTAPLSCYHPLPPKEVLNYEIQAGKDKPSGGWRRVFNYHNYITAHTHCHTYVTVIHTRTSTLMPAHTYTQ